MIEFFNDERGQAMTEYALTLVFLMLAFVGVYRLIANSFTQAFENIVNSISLTNMEDITQGLF
ncbi:MAG: hypothetical protein JW827_02855 [Spirochaetes bacterium]|nr:hypothetical protein [Spirochaetota bacterium]